MKVAVSLWVEDGGVTAFAHRSLQEYFAALFIKELDEKSKEKIYLKMLKNSESLHSINDVENFLSLCEEMDETFFNKHYAIPILLELKEKISGRDPLNKFVTFFINGLIERNSTPKRFTPQVNDSVYKSIYFHIPFTLKLHQMISSLKQSEIFPDGTPARSEKEPYSRHYFNKSKGLKTNMVTSLRKAGADKLANKLLEFVEKNIEKRSKKIEDQKQSNADLIDMLQI